MQDYYETTTALEHLHTLANPAEIQGMLCALLCLDNDTLFSHWLTFFITDYDPHDLLAKEATHILQQLQQQTWSDLNNEDFDFKLLLPDDDSALEERAEALALWCQGFIIAWNKSNNNEQDIVEVQEILDDLLAISQTDYLHLEENEEHERALMELSEFIKTGVLLIFQHLKPKMRK